jgi:hypothetical protein
MPAIPGISSEILQIVEFGHRVGQRADASVVEPINPGVHGEGLAALPGVLDDGGAGDMQGLLDDVEFAEAINGFLVRKLREFFLMAPVQRADAGEPVVDEAVAEIFQSRAHTAAAVVSADDDVFHLEDIDGVLHDGEGVEVGLLDDVGDVAVDEDLAGGESGDLVGGHAAVRAADPKVFGRLLVGEVVEKFRISGGDGVGPFLVRIEKMFEAEHELMGIIRTSRACG